MRVKRFLKDSKRYAVIPFVLTVNLLAQLWSILQLQDAKCGSVDDQFTSRCCSHNKNSFWLESNIYNVQLLWTIKMQTKINECPASDISDLCPQMDLNVSICSNSWSYFFIISFYVSLRNIYLYMRFFMTVWSNFTMQHESGWITMYLSSLGKNDQHLYYTSLNAYLPSSDPHLRLMWMTQRIPTHIISHPDFKQRYSSIFTSKLNKLITNTLSLVVDHKVWEIRW